MQNHLLPFFKALANENRQRILFEILSDKQEHSVSEVAQRIGIAPSTASEHLSILKRASIVIATKREKEVYYAINRESFLDVFKEIENWLNCC